MKVLAVLLCLGAPAIAQNSAPPSQPSAPQAPPSTDQQPPSYANYSIVLVNPVLGGGAVVIMHNPKNELEFVPVSNTKQALDAGYVAVRAVELGELIAALKEENARLAAENAQLRGQSPAQMVTAPAPQVASQAEIDAQRDAQIAADQAARRQQLIQAWMNINRPQTRNPTQPYQLPPPVNLNANRLKANCTAQTVGDTTYTDCH